MDRNIHDIYDVILKIIVVVYGTAFLNFIGIDGELKKILNVEITKLKGKKYFLDFLGLMDDGTLCHIEFQYPYSLPDDDRRFFEYNISAEVRYEMKTETYVFEFVFHTRESECQKMGKTKGFMPIRFCLSEIDFEEYFKNINIKVKSDKALTNFEEIVLMLMPICPKFKGDVQVLKSISEILVKKELFDETKYEFVQSVVLLEIENFLTEDEQKEIFKEIDMTPQAEDVVTRVIGEVNRKVLYEAEQRGIEQGLEQGLERGKNEAMEDIAVKLKDTLCAERISEITGLPLSQIEKL